MYSCDDTNFLNEILCYRIQIDGSSMLEFLNLCVSTGFLPKFQLNGRVREIELAETICNCHF